MPDRQNLAAQRAAPHAVLQETADTDDEYERAHLIMRN
jgi:hypothetical protein